MDLALTTPLYRHRYRRRLRARRAWLRADLPCHQRGEFRPGRILHGRGLSDGRTRSKPDLPYWAAFIIALLGMALLGVIFNLGVYYPLRHRTYLPVIIATIGASILMANSVLAIYGPQPQVLEGWFETPGIQLGPVYLDSQYLLIIGVTICTGDLQLLVLRDTRCSARSCRRPRRTRKWPRCSAFPSPP